MESFWIIIRKYYHMNPELLLFLLLLYVSVFFVYIVKFIDFQSKSVSMSRLNRVSGMVTILNEWFILCRWTILSPELFLLLKWNDWLSFEVLYAVIFAVHVDWGEKTCYQGVCPLVSYQYTWIGLILRITDIWCCFKSLASHSISPVKVSVVLVVSLNLSFTP